MTILIPQSVEEVKNGFKKHTILYTGVDGTVYVLNPFGGGHTATQECKLAEDWEVTNDKLKRIKMILK